MSDDRYNANGDHPYLFEPPPPGVRRAKRQPFWQDGNRYVAAEEILEFVRKQYPETVKQKRKLERPPGWDEIDKAAAELVLGASMTTDAVAGSSVGAEVSELVLFGDTQADPAEEFER